MAWGYIAVGAGTLIGGYLAGQGAQSAGNQAANSQLAGVQAQKDMFNTIQQQNQPYMQAGQTALNQLNAGTAQGGQFAHTFDANDLKTNLAPNYQWQLDQGLQATQNAANLQGGLSGNQLKAVNDYAQNYAGNAYQNAFANYNTNQTNIFNRLSSIAGLGQNAAANTGNNGAQISSGVASSYAGAGAAQAAGTVGQANAYGNALGGAAMWAGLGQNNNQYSASYYGQQNNNPTQDYLGGYAAAK